MQEQLLKRDQAIDAVGIEAVRAVEAEHCEVSNIVGYNGACQGDELTKWHADVGCTFDGEDDAVLRAVYYTTNEQDAAIEAAGGDGGAIDWEIAGYQIF